MLRLYCQSRGNSQEIQLVRPMPVPQWEALKRGVIRYMEQTFQPPGSIAILKEIPFELWEGTNGFNDEFELLYLRTDMATYIELEREDDTGEFRARLGYPDVANALQKLGHSIRFIAVEMDLDQDVASVAVPTLTVTSDVVEAALHDAGTTRPGPDVSPSQLKLSLSSLRATPPQSNTP